MFGFTRPQTIALLVMVALIAISPFVLYPVFLMRVLCMALFACAFNLMLGYVGLTVLPPFVAFHVPYISAEARRDCLEQYRAHLLTLEQRAPLAFPSLDDFDDRLQPKVVAASTETLAGPAGNTDWR